MCMRISELGTGRGAGRAGHQEVGWEIYSLSGSQGVGLGRRGPEETGLPAGLAGQVGVDRWVSSGKGM